MISNLDFYYSTEDIEIESSLCFPTSEIPYRRFSRFSHHVLIEDASMFYAREHNISSMQEIAICLRGDIVGRNIDEIQLQKALNKMSTLVREMGWALDSIRDYVRFDDFIDDSVVVRFPHNKDIRLNIYFDDEAQEDNSSEECYLSYRKQGRRCVESDSIVNVSKKLKQLLK